TYTGLTDRAGAARMVTPNSLEIPMLWIDPTGSQINNAGSQVNVGHIRHDKGQRCAAARGFVAIKQLSQFASSFCIDRRIQQARLVDLQRVECCGIAVVKGYFIEIVLPHSPWVLVQDLSQRMNILNIDISHRPEQIAVQLETRQVQFLNIVSKRHL